MHQLTIRTATPVVSLVDGQAVTTSTEVARVFGKRHDDVLRAIRALVAQLPPDGLRNFAEGVYTLPATGDQQHAHFTLSRDGLSLLAMGFTGKRALAFKLAYIAAFNRMEAQLLAAANQAPSLTTRRWLISYDHTGKEQVLAVPHDACVMSLPQALQLLTDPDGPQIDTQLLADFIGAASQKLARRCAWHQGRAAALKGGKP